MSLHSKLKCLLIGIVIGLSLSLSEGHEHPRRHHHNFRKGQYIESGSTDWDSLIHKPDFEDVDYATSREDQRDHFDKKSSKQKQLFEDNKDEYYSKNAIKESKKDYKKGFGAESLISSTIFFNETVDRGTMTYSGQTVYDDADYIKSTDMINHKLDSEEPIPAATRARNEDSQNSFLSAPRWTLKYQGVATEQALNNTKINVTASVGGNAFLPCKVGHLGDRQLLYNFQISWIRRRDWHVLTSGKILYTHDERFSVLHEPGSQDWTLHIKWVTMKDTGTYECQVSTGTGIISLFVKLRVVIPEAFIPGDGQYHVDKGSSIALKCYIKNSPVAPQYILWHHNGELLNFLRNRPDIVITDDLNKNKNNFVFGPKNGVDTGMVETVNVDEKVFVSRLRVGVADDTHSGNYTCSAPNTDSASTLVFITEGDKTAAVQRIDSGSSAASDYQLLVASLLFIGALFHS